MDCRASAYPGEFHKSNEAFTPWGTGLELLGCLSISGSIAQLSKNHLQIKNMELEVQLISHGGNRIIIQKPEPAIFKPRAASAMVLFLWGAPAVHQQSGSKHHTCRRTCYRCVKNTSVGRCGRHKGCLWSIHAAWLWGLWLQGAQQKARSCKRHQAWSWLGGATHDPQ